MKRGAVLTVTAIACGLTLFACNSEVPRERLSIDGSTTLTTIALTNVSAQDDYMDLEVYAVADHIYSSPPRGLLRHGDSVVVAFRDLVDANGRRFDPLSYKASQITVYADIAGSPPRKGSWSGAPK